ncbi:hypothetical protein PR202_gb16492 [Eleusine coracana subsp. coracana]|uniref:NAC domain-containing protein n=1 Tax=Eleusine coracana subsp. coracana TaxID=191504 RepID=A0AAV5EY87_ELECO|nr:hypothetical protein PR202_gb16492 [Eleusine coracana subsp. coracana]
MAPSLPAPMESVLHLGFRFEPTPHQAVTYYLPRLIAGEPMHPAIRAFIHTADIYASAPGALAAQFRPTPGKSDRFFFTTVERQRMRQGKDVRYVRVAGPGSWTFQRSDDVKDHQGGSGNVKVGEVRKLRYKYRNGGAATDWLMEEYSCACGGGGVKGAMVGDKERVFCRVYVSPNAAADSPARQESAAFFSAPPPPLPEPAVLTKKRPPPPPLEPAMMVVARKRTLPPPEPAVVTAPAMVRKRPPPLVIVKPTCPKRIRGAPISPIRPPSPAAAARMVPSPRPGTPQKMQLQQQQASLPKLSTVPRQLPPPRASAPVKQEPLAPRLAPAAGAFALSDDHNLRLSTGNNGAAAKAEDGFDDLYKELDKLPALVEAAGAGDDAAPPPPPEDDDFEDFVSDIEAKLETSQVLQVVASSSSGGVQTTEIFDFYC